MYGTKSATPQCSCIPNQSRKAFPPGDDVKKNVEKNLQKAAENREEFSSNSKGLFKLGEMPSESADGPHIDTGSTLIKAMNALQPDQINSMTSDTKQLLETQQNLMGLLKNMAPVQEKYCWIPLCLHTNAIILQSYCGKIPNRKWQSPVTFIHYAPVTYTKDIFLNEALLMIIKVHVRTDPRLQPLQLHSLQLCTTLIKNKEKMRHSDKNKRKCTMLIKK